MKDIGTGRELQECIAFLHMKIRPQQGKGPVIMQTATKTRFTPAPRPRMSLRQAMRAQGLDEHKVARVFNRQVNRLQRRPKPKKGLPAAQEKLLLEVLKESWSLRRAQMRRRIRAHRFSLFMKFRGRRDLRFRWGIWRRARTSETPGRVGGACWFRRVAEGS